MLATGSGPLPPLLCLAPSTFVSAVNVPGPSSGSSGRAAPIRRLAFGDPPVSVCWHAAGQASGRCGGARRRRRPRAGSWADVIGRVAGVEQPGACCLAHPAGGAADPSVRETARYRRFPRSPPGPASSALGALQLPSIGFLGRRAAAGLYALSFKLLVLPTMLEPGRGPGFLRLLPGWRRSRSSCAGSPSARHWELRCFPTLQSGRAECSRWCWAASGWSRAATAPAGQQPAERGCSAYGSGRGRPFAFSAASSGCSAGPSSPGPRAARRRSRSPSCRPVDRDSRCLESSVPPCWGTAPPDESSERAPVGGVVSAVCSRPPPSMSAN